MKARIAVAGALLAVTGAAGAAEITATATLTSDYDFRGITQTQGEPAFQLGLNYGADSGIYMGVWGSNVKFGNTEDWQIYGRRPSTEIDVYAGYAGGDAEETFGYDIGAIYYGYPNGTAGNFPEVYAGVSKGFFNLKLWYSWDYAGSGDTAYYVDTNFNLPMANDFSFLVHAGYSGAEYHNNRWGRTGGLGEYLDWSLGVALDVDGWTAAFKYVDGSDANSNPRNLGRFVFSLSTTLGGGE
ncbi:MAG: TorF family putative porin [Pseudomonadota bacterium]|nr:TorF family putative porin [Pseudomonadota bacterium]